MKLTLIRKDKQNIVHLTTRTMESFIERIQTDTKPRDITRLREHLSRGNELRYYAPLEQLTQVYPSAELTKEKNGALRIVALNGIVALHVGGLLQANEREVVKEAAQSLPMTLAAFAGGDGQSVEVLVKVCDRNGTLPQSEEDADAFCRAAYSRALAVYSGVLSKDIDNQAGAPMSHFLMPLDPAPYYNPDAVPLRIPLSSPSLSPANPLPTIDTTADSPIASATRQLIDFLDAHYAFRHNTIMGYTEYRSKNASVEGYSFYHLAQIINKVEDKSRVGICIDTCHTFTAGYDLKDNYDAVWREFGDVVGFEYLRAIHLNDSMKPLGSRVDRHHSIGQGLLGLDFFRTLMNDERFNDIPLILETPDESLWPDEIALLHSFEK